MTTEKILTKLYEVTNSLETEDKDKLAGLIYSLEEDLRKEEAKKNRKSSALTAAKNILKKAKNNSLKTEFHYARDTEDGQLIMDGQQMVLLKEADKLPFEPMPENIKAEFDYKRVIPHNYTEELVLPDIKKLKAAVKIKKAQHPKDNFIFYDFGKNRPRVPATYLINVMEIIGADICKYKGDYSPILLENSNGSIGLICPVRKNPNGTCSFDITAEDLK